MTAVDTNITKLEACNSDFEIDTYFDNLGQCMRSLAERISVLEKHMGFRGATFCGDVSDEDKYKIAKEVFIGGKWRLIR